MNDEFEMLKSEKKDSALSIQPAALRVPEIRFQGCSGEWVESEFSGIATRVSIQHQGTCLPCVEYEDIVAGEGRFNKDVYRKKTLKAGLKFEVNDVLFGKLRPYLKNWFLADFEGIAVGDFWVLRAYNVASTFLFYLIQTNKFEFISNLSSGSKMPRSDWGLVSSSCFFVPNNIPESNKVGNFFQKLDSLINQHQQKHDKLSNVKKAMLEKMFPKPGKTTPEIRFKGFSGEWEEKPLKKIASDITDGNWIEAEHVFDSGEYRIIQTGNIGVGQYLDRPKHAKYFHQSNFDAVRGNEIFPGDILISRLADPAGRAVILPNTGYKMVTAVDVAIVRPEPCFDSYFFMTLLNRDEILKAVGEWVSGTSHKRISRANLVKMKAVVPCAAEQTAIGNYFQKLDSLINQHQQQITKLNHIKQACLSKMFV